MSPVLANSVLPSSTAVARIGSTAACSPLPKATTACGPLLVLPLVVPSGPVNTPLAGLDSHSPRLAEASLGPLSSCDQARKELLRSPSRIDLAKYSVRPALSGAMPAEACMSICHSSSPETSVPQSLFCTQLMVTLACGRP